MPVNVRDGPFGGDVGEHPGAEELAEYVDHVLTPAARAAIEHHLGRCASCREVVAEATAFIADDEEENEPRVLDLAPAPEQGGAPTPRWIPVAVGTLAVAAALFLAVRLTDDGDTSAGLGELVAALDRESTRPLEGRLTGGFRYAPAASPTRGDAATPLAANVRLAVARIEQAAQTQDSAASGALVGVAHAVEGDYDRAIAELERAIAESPPNARYLSDLSAVYLARGRATDRRDDYEGALSAGQRALALDRSLPEACFNHALALESLDRRDEALRAWEGCLTITPEGPWSAEIRQRIAALLR